jgi:NTE family protein
MEISIALGGGGAKGIAHLGVLRCLEANGFVIRAIAGTSAGGIIAATYAAGYSPQEMLARFQQVDQSRLYGRQTGDGPALLGIAGVNRVLQEMLGDRTFEDLRIPCALTAVDLITENEVLLQRGRVADAVLATIALPGIFPPYHWEEYYLVDGGLLDPVPVAPARSLAPRLPVVAVVLSNLDPRPLNILEPPEFLGRVPLLNRVARLRVAQAFNIFWHSLEISSRHFTAMRLKLDQPDVIIQPKLDDIGIFDRVDITEIAQRGEQAALEALPALRQEFNWRGIFSRYFRAMR